MTADKRETFTVDRDALTQALISKDVRVDRDTLASVADAMAETARAVLKAQGIDVRVKRSRGPRNVPGARAIQKRSGARSDGTSILAGQGLSTPISSEEGLNRLRDQAVQMPIEQWAGEVLGPKKAADTLGIRRSTLDNWRTRGEIIALPKGKSAHVIPMAQFVDSRPLPGVGRVLEIAHGSASIAWNWLLTPHVDFDAEPPLHALSAGEKEAVCAAAERSIG